MADRLDRPERTEKTERIDRPAKANGSDREQKAKLESLGAFLDRHHLDGVLLQHRNNFAWATCGRDNRIPNNAAEGVAAILMTGDSLICLADSIEAPRMQEEELVGTGIPVISFPWWDPKASAIKLLEVMGGQKIAADADVFDLGLRPLPDDWVKLRWSLTPQEIARYRDGAARATGAVETACREITFGVTEHEVAGLLNYHLHAAGLNPIETLIAADDRIARFRHPIPTGRKVDRYVLLATVAEYKGLVSCLTRLVSFAPATAELTERLGALANIDAAVNLATRPGRSLGEIFRMLQKAYADNGFADEWKMRHQGGSTGYATHEELATPGNPVIVRENQAFAWNPSIPGAMSEDTVLCTGAGVDVLTAPSANWPKIVGRSDAGELARADILVR